MTDGCSRRAAAQVAPATDAAAKRAEKRGPDLLRGPAISPLDVFWRVAHIHTGYILRRRNVRDHADPRRPLQRVVRGGEVVVDNGVRCKLDRPLDWLAINRPCRGHRRSLTEFATPAPKALPIPPGVTMYSQQKDSPGPDKEFELATRSRRKFLPRPSHLSPGKRHRQSDVATTSLDPLG